MQPGQYPYPAPPGPPAGRGPQVRPAAWWFAVAGLVVAAGVVGFVVTTVVVLDAYGDRIERFERSGVPATLDIEITETGGYSIYQEYTGADDGFFRPGLEVTVTDPSGDPVALERYEPSVTYVGGGHEGRGEFTFEAAEAGVYTVTATGPPGSTVAVGRGVGTGLIAGIGAALLVGLGGVVGGAVMAIVVGVKRSRARRALLPAFGAWGPPPPGGWGPSPAPPGGWGQRPPPPPGGWGPPAGGPPPPPGPPDPSDAPRPRPPGPSDAPPGPPGPSDAPPRPPGPSDAPPPGRPGPSDASPPGPPAGGPPAPPGRRSGPGDGPPAPPPGPPPPGATVASSLPSPGRAGAPGPAAPGAGAPPPNRTGHPALRANEGGPTDPPSLRSPVDWSRSDLPLHWSGRR